MFNVECSSSFPAMCDRHTSDFCNAFGFEKRQQEQITYEFDKTLSDTVSTAKVTANWFRWN